MLEPDAGGDEDGAAVVDRRPLVLASWASTTAIRSSAMIGDRDVDPEDGPPRPLRQVAAEDRPDGRQATGDPEEERERLAALAEGEHVDHDGERGREHEGAAGSLDHPERDDPRLGDGPLGGEPAQRRRADEDDHADDAHLGVAEDVRQPAAQGEQRGQGDQVAVHHPLHAGRGQPELALDVRHGDGDDRLVDERHGDREDHRGEDPVAPLHAVPSHCTPPASSFEATLTDRPCTKQESTPRALLRRAVARGPAQAAPVSSASICSSAAWSGPDERLGRRHRLEGGDQPGAARSPLPPGGGC